MQALKPSSQFTAPGVFSRSREIKIEHDKVNLRLTREKALILHGMLSRLNNDPTLKLDHPAERKVLWDLEYLLLNSMPETQSPKYESKLAQAREHTWPRPEPLAMSS